MTTPKNSNSDKTKENQFCDKTQYQIVTKLKNSNKTKLKILNYNV